MDTISPPPRRLDGRAVALQNELSVLKAVRQYGHLRRVEIARIVWPKSSKHSARLMSERKVKLMLSQGLLAERPNALGGRSLILTHKGVARLRENSLDAQDGYDLSSVDGAQFYHRTVGTCYLIERGVLGHTPLSEYTLSRISKPIGRAELAERFHKVPDGIVLVPGKDRGYDGSVVAADWIEVESSFKSDEEIARILEIAWKAGSYLNVAETVFLDRVVFVYNDKQRHETSILNSLRRYLRENPIDNRDGILNSIMFVRCSIDIPLVFRGYEELLAPALLRMKGTETQDDE
jgi:hypothetical protein